MLYITVGISFLDKSFMDRHPSVYNGLGLLLLVVSVFTICSLLLIFYLEIRGRTKAQHVQLLAQRALQQQIPRLLTRLHDNVLKSGADEMHQAFEAMDMNGDGMLEMAELAANLPELTKTDLDMLHTLGY